LISWQVVAGSTSGNKQRIGYGIDAAAETTVVTTTSKKTTKKISF
jgi:hypothetical protein